jgi:hypothetical protein
MQINRRFSKTLAAVLTAALTAALLAAGAVGAEQTRESYVAQVEPICKKNTKANEQILAGVEKTIRKGKLSVAAGKFSRAAGAFGKAVNEIRAVPQPSADAAKLNKWIGYLKKEKDILASMSKALKKEQKGKVRSLSIELDRNGRKANNVVLTFEFDYCLIESTRFS